MHVRDDKAFIRAAIMRIDRRFEELARPQPKPISSVVLLSIYLLAVAAGSAIFGAGMVFGRWLG